MHAESRLYVTLHDVSAYTLEPGMGWYGSSCWRTEPIGVYAHESLPQDETIGLASALVEVGRFTCV